MYMTPNHYRYIHISNISVGYIKYCTAPMFKTKYQLRYTCEKVTKSLLPNDLILGRIGDSNSVIYIKLKMT
jgi:hypothetical protein